MEAIGEDVTTLGHLSPFKLGINNFGTTISMEMEQSGRQMKNLSKRSRNKKKIVRFEPPLAHKPTQFAKPKKIEPPELLLSTILAPSIDYRRKRLNFDSK